MDEGRPSDLRSAHHAPDRLKDIFVVFNPHSGKGRGSQFIQPVLQHLAAGEKLEHGLTQGPGDEARLATTLGREAETLDALAERSGLSIDRALAALTRLEWAGLARVLPGQRWASGRS